MIETLKKEVCRANLDLVREGLVVQTWGNVSGVDRARGLMVIKPSGVAYASLKAAQMVVVSLDTGKPWQAGSAPALTRQRIWFSIQSLRTSEESPTLTAFMPRPGRKRAKASLFLEQPKADYWQGGVPADRASNAGNRKKLRREYRLCHRRKIQESGPAEYSGGAGGGPRAICLGQKRG